MSAKQISLKSPATIVVVVVLLVAVTIMNVRTFGGRPGVGKTTSGHRVQAHPPVPSDVSSLVNRKISPAIFEGKSSAPANVDYFGRDPFLLHQRQSEIVMQTSTTQISDSCDTENKIQPLQCSAIMMVGSRPMAILDGKGCCPGDEVRGMILTSIDTKGVSFRDSTGSTIHLAVGIQENKNTHYRVITRTRKSEDQGRTRLVDQK